MNINNTKLQILVEYMEKGFASLMAKVKELEKALRKSEGQKKRFITLYQKTNKQLKEFTAKTKQANKGLFNMKVGMFGVLFFGMSLQRMFFGLLEPALALTGFFEILTAVLQLLFLPVALWLLDVLMPIFEWLMNLDDGTKLLIGKIVLFLGILAGGLVILTFVLLGIAAIVSIFGVFWNMMSGILTPIGAFFTLILGIGGLASLFDNLAKAFKPLKDKFDEWWAGFINSDKVKNFFKSLGIDIAAIKDPVKFLRDKTTEFFEKFKKDHPEFSKFFDDMKIKIDGWIDNLSQFKDTLEKDIIPLMKDLLQIAKNIWDTGILQAIGQLIKFGSGLVAKATNKENLGLTVAATGVGAVAGGAIGGLPGAAIGATAGLGGSIVVDLLKDLVKNTNPDNKPSFPIGFSNNPYASTPENPYPFISRGAGTQ